MADEPITELLERFGYPEGVTRIVRPVMELYSVANTWPFQRAVCELTLELIDKVLKGTLSGREADQAFTLLAVFCSEQTLGSALSEEVGELLREGQELHHYGDQRFGPDLQRMRNLAQAYLKGKGNGGQVLP